MPTSPTQPAVAASQPPAKARFDMLLLSDSMFRHVAADNPNPPNYVRGLALQQDIPIALTKSEPHKHFTVKKVIVPGARCPRLLAEASALALNFEFDEVVVSCGTNYLQDSEAAEIITDTQQLLWALKGLFKCQITFSPIIPRVTQDEQKPENRREPLSQFSYEMLDKTRCVNAEVIVFCDAKSFDLLFCPDFIMHKIDYPNKWLLAKDGCHLNRRGIVAMDNALFDHIYSNVLGF